MDKVKKIIQFAFLSLLILFLSSKSEIKALTLQNSQEALTITSSFSITLIDSKSLYIHEDQDFIEYGFRGTGTIDNPYIIENLRISNKSAMFGIWVAHVTKYFVIQNCVIEVRGVAILIDHVSRNRTIIRNNDCNGGRAGTGIRIDDTRNVTIVNNFCSGNEEGIILYNSHFAPIINNSCGFNSIGISVLHSNDCEITENECYYNYYGISSKYSFSGKIVGNHCWKNEYYGIVLEDSSNYLVSNNTCERNWQGIRGETTNFCEVTNNVLIKNEYMGISFLYGAANNTFHHNLFFLNRLLDFPNFLAPYPQANDGGVNNSWYEITTNIGNYWSNHQSVGVYNISGSALNFDPYPVLAPDDDNDTLDTYLEEVIFLTNPHMNDTDSDLIIDGEEVLIYFTSPTRADSDYDGLKDGEEIFIYLTDPLDKDTDDDNLNDGTEILVYNSDPFSPDTDGDEMPDGWEAGYNLNLLVNDSFEDPDDDGLTNLDEYLNSANPHLNDSDGDGLEDGEEVFIYNTRPISPDSDADGLEDGEEVFVYHTYPNDTDTDDDGLKDGEEILEYLTNATNPDTDSDGMWDGWEVKYSLNPLVNDAEEDLDNDKLTNFEEFQFNTNPQDDDTDGDGADDGYEIRTNHDPLDALDYPMSKEVKRSIYLGTFTSLLFGCSVLIIQDYRNHWKISKKMINRVKKV